MLGNFFVQGQGPKSRCKRSRQHFVHVSFGDRLIQFSRDFLCSFESVCKYKLLRQFVIRIDVMHLKLIASV